jgi:hypothetical protein
LGIILAIEPWNFPYYQIARILAPQLSAGNTMLLKHASNVPQSAAAFEQLMREAGSPWKVSVAVDPKLIGATNVRLIANKIAGEPTPATYDFKAAAIPQALLAAQPGAVNVASLGKIIPGWGQTEDFIAPWFATLEAKNK